MLPCIFGSFKFLLDDHVSLVILIMLNGYAVFSYHRIDYRIYLVAKMKEGGRGLITGSLKKKLFLVELRWCF